MSDVITCGVVVRIIVEEIEAVVVVMGICSVVVIASVLVGSGTVVDGTERIVVVLIVAVVVIKIFGETLVLRRRI